MTVLEYTQLGDIRETNAFAYADQSIEKNRWRFNVGARLDYFNFHYNDKLSTDQLPDQQKVIVSPKAEHSIHAQYKNTVVFENR